jgi:hypothetical protein
MLMGEGLENITKVRRQFRPRLISKFEKMHCQSDVRDNGGS